MEAGFVFDTMSEFNSLWRSGVEATGQVRVYAFSMNGLLGHPQDLHVKVKKKRWRSVNRPTAPPPLLWMWPGLLMLKKPTTIHGPSTALSTAPSEDAWKTVSQSQEELKTNVVFIVYCD